MYNNIIHDKNRESDLQQMAKGILNTSPKFWDNPNGAYESECPFCNAIEYGSGEICWYYMHQIEHKQDCCYLIAKDLMTNII